MKTRASAYTYAGLALVVLGAQLPVRFSSCAAATACVLSFAKAPIWAAIWPVYLYFALPPEIKAVVFLSGAIIMGGLFGFALSRDKSRSDAER